MTSRTQVIYAKDSPDDLWFHHQRAGLTVTPVDQTICSSNPTWKPFQDGAPHTQSSSQEKEKENVLYEAKSTNEDNQKSQVIKSRALLSNAENSKIGTALKTARNLPEYTFNYLSEIPVLPNYYKEAAAARPMRLHTKCFVQAQTKCFSFVPWAQVEWFSNWMWSGHLCLKSEQLRKTKPEEDSQHWSIKSLVKIDAFKWVSLTLLSSKSGSFWVRCYSGHESRGSGFAWSLIFSIWHCTWHLKLCEWMNEWNHNFSFVAKSKFI